MDIKLRPGDYYFFKHQNKGEFYARFNGFVDNPGDDVDGVLADVAVWTEVGSGQERLANSMVIDERGKRTPEFSHKLIRLSQVEVITPADDDAQKKLRTIAANAVHKPIAPPSLDKEVLKNANVSILPPKTNVPWGWMAAGVVALASVVAKIVGV